MPNGYDDMDMVVCMHLSYGGSKQIVIDGRTDPTEKIDTESVRHRINQLKVQVVLLETCIKCNLKENEA